MIPITQVTLEELCILLEAGQVFLNPLRDSLESVIIAAQGPGGEIGPEDRDSVSMIN